MNLQREPSHRAGALRGARAGSAGSEERPPSLLDRRPVEPGVVILGVVFTVGAHLLIPALVLASQWLLVFLGLAIPVEERTRPIMPDNVIAAEFVKLGKPLDPKKLPNRKVPPVAKRTPDGVAVSKDAPEVQKKPEEKKERPKDAKDSLLDNLVDRTKDFAEDVQYEEEGDPNGLREGTATEAREGDLYRGQLLLFFQRPWTVPNIVQDLAKKKATVMVEVASDGRLRSVQLAKSSGDPLYDQSAIDAVTALIQAGAVLPEPPPALRHQFYGATIAVNYDGRNAR
jgi:TonB family protein